MVEKNLKKLQAKKRRVTNGFNTGTRDMKLKTAYRRNKRWSADDAGHSLSKKPVTGSDFFIQMSRDFFDRTGRPVYRVMI